MTPAFVVSLIFGVIFGLLFWFYLSASIFRLAVRIVAGFTPGYGNILLAGVTCIPVLVIVGIGMKMMQGAMGSAMSGILPRILVSFAVCVLIYAVVIRNAAGAALGIMNSFFSLLLCRLISLALVALFVAAMIGVYGYRPVVNAFAVGIRNARATYARTHPTAAAPVLTAPPSVDQILQQPLPGPAHYYLKSPITVTVSYGQMTYPADTEVQLLNQSGDACQIQLANATCTISRSQLVMVQH